MNATKLARIKGWIEDCREKSKNLRHSDLERIAHALGRVRVKRGKEPTYKSTEFPRANVITIPSHAGKTLRLGTAESILDQLEEDVFRFEQRLHSELKGVIDETRGHEN